MERYRQADDPNRHVNMDEIEDHLRNKLGLSPSEWQVLVDKSVDVDNYASEMHKQAHSLVQQDRTARRESPPVSNTLVANHATLHKMQSDLNSHVQGVIDQLKASLGPNATTQIQNYLQGPMTASMTAVSVKAAHLRAQKEQAQ